MRKMQSAKDLLSRGLKVSPLKPSLTTSLSPTVSDAANTTPKPGLLWRTAPILHTKTE